MERTRAFDDSVDSLKRCIAISYMHNGVEYYVTKQKLTNSGMPFCNAVWVLLLRHLVSSKQTAFCPVLVQQKGQRHSVRNVQALHKFNHKIVGVSK